MLANLRERITCAPAEPLSADQVEAIHEASCYVTRRKRENHGHT